MNRKNEKPPQFLYKYFSIKDKCERKHSRDIFEHNELFFRNPKKFNDPFDCRAMLTLRDCKEKEYVKFEIGNATDSKGPLDNRQKQFYKEIAKKRYNNSNKNQLIRNINNIIKKGLDASINQFRVLCLSETYNDILMWSHYAGGHRGFVLQFNTEALKDNFKPQPPQKVFYPKKESFPSIRDFNKRKRMQSFLITKSSHWKYEKEWRILTLIGKGDNPQEEGKVYKFKKGLITGIILGCEMEGPRKKEILEWIRKYRSHVKIHNAIKDKNCYKIKSDPQIKEHK